MTHGRFDLVTPDGGPTPAARVLVALSKLDPELPLCMPDLFAAAGVSPTRVRNALHELKTHGYVESDPGFGRHRDRRYDLTPLGRKMARKLVRSPALG